MDAPVATWDLQHLAEAHRFSDWLYEQFATHVRGRVAEIGPGIGTFSRRILDSGVEELVLVEPDDPCADILARDVATRPGVSLAREMLPEAPALASRPGAFDFVLCQNVLEHIPDDYAATAAMAAALAPNGVLTILVPAHPWLYGPLDHAYGHERRYTVERLREVVEHAGLEVLDLYRFNSLGTLGWLAARRHRTPRLSPRSLRAYEFLLPPFRALERRRRPPVGLSLIVHAARGRRALA